MRWTNIFARLRRPTVITVSVAACAASLMTTGATSQAPIAAPQRIVATPVPIPVFKPHKISIPTIGVESATVVPVGTLQSGAMQSPGGADEVGWWAGRKVGKGNVLLDGHHDWNGKIGVFYELPKLKPGDEFVVTGDKPDKTATYRVVWVKNYDRSIDATDLLGNKSKKQIATLITCGGTFDTIARTHRERVVARAELVTS